MAATAMARMAVAMVARIGLFIGFSNSDCLCCVIKMARPDCPVKHDFR